MIILLVQAPRSFIGICHESIFYKHVHRKVPYCHGNTTRILRFSPISSKEGNEPTPVLWYWILKELRTVPSQWSKMKIFTSYYWNFFDFQRNNICIWMGFNRIIHRSFWLLVCLIPSSNRWELCGWSSTIVVVTSSLTRFLIIWFKRGSSRVLLNVPIL